MTLCSTISSYNKSVYVHESITYARLTLTSRTPQLVIPPAATFTSASSEPKRMSRAPLTQTALRKKKLDTFCETISYNYMSWGQRSSSAARDDVCVSHHATKPPPSYLPLKMDAWPKLSPVAPCLLPLQLPWCIGDTVSAESYIYVVAR